MGLLRPNLEEEEREKKSSSNSNVAGNTSNSCRSFSRQGKRIQLKADDEMKRKHDDLFDSRPRNDVGVGGGGGGVWEYPPPLSASSKTKVIVGFESPPAPEHGFAAGRGGGGGSCIGKGGARKISPLADILSSDPNSDGLLHYTSDDGGSGDISDGFKAIEEQHQQQQEPNSSKIKSKNLSELSRKAGGSAPVAIPGAEKVVDDDCSGIKRREEDVAVKSWGSPTKKTSASQLLTLSPLGRRLHASRSEVWETTKETRGMLRTRSMSLDDDYNEFRDDKIAIQDASLGGCFKNGLPRRRPLVGSFEESLLSGRFLAGKSCQKLDGFLALLSVSGGSWSPQVRKLPFSVSCIDGDSCLLYYASIDIVDGKAKLKQANTCTKEWKGSRFRVPIRGRVQLVVSNPEKTPVHTFICGYDLTDMPPGTKTFMRQKLSLASSAGSNRHRSVTPASTRDDSSCGRRLCSGSSGAGRGDKRSGSGSGSGLDRVQERIGIVSSSSSSGSVKSSTGKDRLAHSAQNKPQPQQQRLQHQQQSQQQQHQQHHHHQQQQHLQQQQQQDKVRQILFQQKQHRESLFQEQEAMDVSLKQQAKTGRTSSFQQEQQEGTVLRYALHLRFMCAPLKKQDHEDDEDSKAAAAVAVDKRRFYLYGELRVVFPQRQSDSDEGKMKVEYDFPSDPKYFEYI